MNIALPILLLVFGGLSFWVLNESTLRWYFKTACISVFCLFTVIFWVSIHTFLGWPALEDDLPDKMAVHWVIIKEPNKLTKFNGRIYVLAESVRVSDSNFFGRFFGYKKEKVEPRLYGLKYSREFHEQLEKGVISKLRQGKPVAGKFTKQGQKGRPKDTGEPRDGEGGGSESQEQDWEFHELLPSEIHSKPSR